MIQYEKNGERYIRSYSDLRHFINDITAEVYDFYEEYVYVGHIDEYGVGHFNNGHIFTESSKEIPHEPDSESQE